MAVKVKPIDLANSGDYPQKQMQIVSLVLFIIIMFACAGNPNGSGPSVSVEELRKLRQNMVNRQIIARGVKDPLVLEAMDKVERHQFVLPGQERQAYDDGPLSIGEGQTISQPYIVAIMTELAKIGPESKVLEIGTGSGYQAAILGEIAKEVYSIEIIETLGLRAQNVLQRLGYKNIQVRIGDGYKGWPNEAPFDAILVTAAPDHVPQPLVDQLKVGGRMVIPVGELYQELEVITKTARGIEREKIIPVRFVPMTGEAEDN
jgi:protein-L-isoaspartate(D-aspartate) O-methyltransferase